MVMDSFPIACRVKRSQAESELQKLLSSGDAVHIIRVEGDDGREFKDWVDEVLWFLRQRFNTPEFLEDMTSILADGRDNAQKLIRILVYLNQLQNRLPYFDFPAEGQRVEDVSEAPKTDVFIVHGHHTARRDEVVNLINKLAAGELNCIVLQDEPNIGRTLIEKFEDHASGVGFAVAILTADDVGGAKSRLSKVVEPLLAQVDGRAGVSAVASGFLGELSSRARQNVVFEAGYFFGLLGRARVVILLDEEVEKPSDIGGLVYISLADDDDDWKLKLGREMLNAELPVDLNRL